MSEEIGISGASPSASAPSSPASTSSRLKKKLTFDDGEDVKEAGSRKGEAAAAPVNDEESAKASLVDEVRFHQVYCHYKYCIMGWIKEKHRHNSYLQIHFPTSSGVSE